MRHIKEKDWVIIKVIMSDGIWHKSTYDICMENCTKMYYPGGFIPKPCRLNGSFPHDILKCIMLKENIQAFMRRWFA